MEIALKRDGSVFQAILRSMFAVSSFMILVKLIAMGKDLIVADKLGTSDALDAFLAAYLVPSFAVYMLGTIPFCIIPSYVELKNSGDKSGLDQLVAKLFWMYLGIVAVVTSGLFFGAEFITTFLFGEKYPPEKLALTLQIFYLLLPLTVTEAFCVMGREILRANKTFTLPSISPVTIPFCNVMCLLFLFDSLGVKALIVGSLIGSVIQALFLGAGIVQHCGHRTLLFSKDHPVKLRRMFRQMIPLSAASIISAVTFIVDNSMAARMGSGAVSTFSYADKTCSIFLVIAIGTIGSVVLPYFSQEISEKNWNGLTQLLKKFILLIGGLGMIGTGILCAFAPEVVGLLFERGEFNTQDTANVSFVLRMLALQIPFHCLGLLLNRLLVGFNVGAYLFGVTCFAALLNVILNIVFSRYMGVAGIALSTTIVHVSSFALFFGRAYWILRNKKREAASAES